MNLLSAQIRNYWITILLVLLTIYFFLAALQGNAGLFRYFQLSAQIKTATEQYDALFAERRSLENLTHRLSDNYLDLDLLDEQARKRLGLIQNDEIIIQ